MGGRTPAVVPVEPPGSLGSGSLALVHLQVVIHIPCKGDLKTEKSQTPTVTLIRWGGGLGWGSKYHNLNYFNFQTTRIKVHLCIVVVPLL